MDNKNQTSQLEFAGQQQFNTLLDALAINYETDGNFFYVGQAPSPADGIIYISVIRPQIWDVLQVVIPQLFSLKLTFQIVANPNVAEAVMCGLMGKENIGKVIIFFIPPNRKFEGIIKQMVELTQNYKGPSMEGQKYLGGLLYSKEIRWSLAYETPEKKIVVGSILKKKYLIVSTLKQDPKGNVFKALYSKKYSWPIKCVIKQGKKHMIADDQLRDIKDRLHWQNEIQKDLTGFINVPKTIDLFEQEGNAYFVMEFISGMPISEVINKLYQQRFFKELKVNEKIKLFALCFQVINFLEKIHEKGYIHRDLSPLNFLLDDKNRVFAIDMELAYRLDRQYPLPPFGMGSPGFISPEQFAFSIPTVKEDIYGLGGLMIGIFANLPAAKYDFQSLAQLKVDVQSAIGNVKITELIVSCLCFSPANRPNLPDIKTQLLSWKAEVLAG